MKSRDFVYWLQGYFEISGTTSVGDKEIQIIKNHLNMVFKHEIDPSNGSEDHNKDLAKIHNPPMTGGTSVRSFDPTTMINC